MGLRIDHECHMGEPGLAGADVTGDFYSFRDGEMGGVRGRPQGIEHEHVGAAGELALGGVHAGTIGVISEFSTAGVFFEDEAEDGCPAVWQQGMPDRSVRECEGLGYFAKGESGIAGELRFAANGVRVDLPDPFQSLARAVNRERDPIPEIAEPAQVVHTENVVGMPVRQNEEVDLFDLIVQALQPEFLRCVNLDVGFSHDHMGTRTGPPVLRIAEVEVGAADVRRLCDHRHALRGPSSKKDDIHGGSTTRESECRTPRKFRAEWIASEPAALHVGSMAKRIVITGLTHGLGRALAAWFVADGHTVLGCGRDAGALADLRKSFGEPHCFERVDVTDSAAVDAWARRVVETGEPPAILVNNAGVINENAPLWQVPVDVFDRVVDVNLKGVFYVIRAFLPAMSESGQGVIVNLSSGWGRSVSPEVAPYCATKWGIEGMTRALAEELPDGLAAVPLNPGVIDTAMLRSCFGAGAASAPSPEKWAERAGPFILQLGPQDNGAPLSV